MPRFRALSLSPANLNGALSPRQRGTPEGPLRSQWQGRWEQGHAGAPILL